MTSPLRGSIQSLAIAFPSVLRTNEWFRKNHSQLVEDYEKHALAKLWNKQTASQPGEPPSAFDRTMEPYLADPFRGTVERRVRAPGESALSMELVAARGALDALGMSVGDIDLLLSTSFPPDRFGVGNAAYLAKELGLHAPAWNYETACSGSVVGLHMAASLVRSGDYRRILVVASASNSAYSVDAEPLGWFAADGAGAFVVAPARAEDHGVLGWKTINSIETNDMFIIESVPHPQLGTKLRGVADAKAAAMARSTAEPYLRHCVDGALSMARRQVQDVDFWIFNTPNAWYADFCAAVLGVESDRYHSVYANYANIGAALMPVTLYYALHARQIRPGSLVGLYSVGSTSTASAVIMRLGEVALGPYPPPAERVDGPSISSL